jgi:hypothetical protein
MFRGKTPVLFFYRRSSASIFFQRIIVKTLPHFDLCGQRSLTVHTPFAPFLA